ncbi:MAG: anti-sigma factor antagonist [Clostridia bacterium]|nr:anti-sigma factor antagonist [Clostridia bacterium]
MNENVKYHVDSGVLYVCLIGRLDANNAPEVEKVINEAKTANPELPVVVDAEKLEYISSAGLRVLLRLRKEKEDLAVINTSTEVYEIFDMTGFAEMMTVKKAYRHLSVDGCKLLGKGANGAVYRYDDETIVKVYFNPDALPDIQRERELARKALVLGINTAIPYDIVRVGDSYGTVMELLSAITLTDMLKKDSENMEAPLKYYVDMLTQIHDTEVKTDDMPNEKGIVLGWAEFDKDHLPKELGDKLYSMVEAVPERRTMMHGDYHTNNVMIREGEALLIDMDTLCWGHPIFELGSMFNAFVGFGEVDPNVTMNFLGVTPEVAKKFWRKALAMYLGTEDEARLNEVEDKAKVVGYTRLLRRTIRRNEPNREELIAYYKEKLYDLIPRINELTF